MCVTVSSLSSGGLNALNVMFYLKDVAAVSDTLNKGQTDEHTHHPVLSHTSAHTQLDSDEYFQRRLPVRTHTLSLCSNLNR